MRWISAVVLALIGTLWFVAVLLLAGLTHKLAVLRERCAAEGRDDETIEKTCTMLSLDVGENGIKTGEVIAGLRRLAGMGIQTVICSVKDAYTITPLEIVGREVIPAVSNLE